MATTDLLIESFKEAVIPAIREIVHEEFKKKQAEELTEKFVSIDEARKLFTPNVSRGTMINWDAAGYVQSYLIGGKRYFKYSELLESIQKIKKYSRNNDLSTTK